MQGASVYLIVPHTHSVLCLVDNTVFENVCKNGSRECQPAIRVTPACCFARHAVSTTLHQFSQRTLCATWSHVQCIRLKFECVALAANRQREIWKNSRGMHANTSKVCWWCELVFCYCNACWCLYAHVRPRHMILECYDDTALDKHWNDDATSHMHRTSSMVHDYTHSWCWWSPSWNDEFNSHSQWAECVMKCLLACECVQAETYIYCHCCYCSRYCDVHSIHIHTQCVLCATRHERILLATKRKARKKHTKTRYCLLELWIEISCSILAPQRQHITKKIEILFFPRTFFNFQNLWLAFLACLSCSFFTLH